MGWKRMNRLRLWIILLAALESVGTTSVVWGYEAEIHQQLTFIAARQFNQCVQTLPDIQRLSALDTRYIVKANVGQADTNVFVRLFRWNYYNRDDQSSRSTLGMIDTRFHDHFASLTEDMMQAQERRQRLHDLGELLNYIQNVTSPAHVVPVYTGRWWRFSFGDRFNRFAVEPERIEAAVDSSCAFLDVPPDSYQQVLVDAANETVISVQGWIYGFPTTWESYWQFANKADEFGEYGPAGNAFGERTEFRCGDQAERCLLLKNDPLYKDFAVDRHVAAVIATMRAMVLLQMDGPEPL